jgi:membrane protein DedA with SNARE-associated domain
MPDANRSGVGMPVDLSQILDLIREHGDKAYAFIFAYSASHAMLFVLFAGYVAHNGALDWSKLVLICWAGSFFGDVVRFWIGRRFGTGWLRRFPRVKRSVDLSARLVDRHYWWIPLIHRYPNGIRSVAAFAFGMSRLPRMTFLALNLVSAGIWSVAIVSIGYAFGHVSEKSLSDVASGASLATMLVFLGLFWFLSKRLDQVVERG